MIINSTTKRKSALEVDENGRLKVAALGTELSVIDADGRLIGPEDSVLARYALNLVPGGVEDNTSVFNELMADAVTAGWGNILLPCGGYGWAGTIAPPGQISLWGRGRSVGTGRLGTRFIRTHADARWNMIGTGSGTGSPTGMHKNFVMRDIALDGAGFSTRLLQAIRFYLHEWVNIEIRNASNTLVYVEEGWDSDISKLKIFFGGNSPTAEGAPAVDPTAFETAMGFGVGSPAFHIKSPNSVGSDTARDLRINELHMETSLNNGMQLFIEGGNGVNIQFSGGKVEAVEPTVPLVGCDEQVAVDFGTFWVLGKGTRAPTQSVPALVALNACRGVRGRFIGGVQSGTRNTTVATYGSLIKAVGPQAHRVSFEVLTTMDGFEDTVPSLIDVTGDPVGDNDFEVYVPDFIRDDWETDRPGIPFPPTLPTAYATREMRRKPPEATTWALRGTGRFDGEEKFITDINCTVRWNSAASLWKAKSEVDIVFDTTTSTGSTSGANQVVKQAAIAGGLLLLGRKVAFNVRNAKNGTNDAVTTSTLHLGTNANLTDQIIFSPTGLSAPNRSMSGRVEYQVVNATTLRLLGNRSNNGHPWSGGQSTATAPADVTISTAANALTLTCGADVAGTTDAPIVDQLIVTVYP